MPPRNPKLTSFIYGYQNNASASVQRDPIWHKYRIYLTINARTASVHNKSKHKNRCPDARQTLLFEDGINSIIKWMHDFNRTDAELAYCLLAGKIPHQILGGINHDRQRGLVAINDSSGQSGPYQLDRIST
jgi:hypothetical protein